MSVCHSLVQLQESVHHDQINLAAPRCFETFRVLFLIDSLQFLITCTDSIAKHVQRYDTESKVSPAKTPDRVDWPIFDGSCSRNNYIKGFRNLLVCWYCCFKLRCSVCQGNIKCCNTDLSILCWSNCSFESSGIDSSDWESRSTKSCTDCTRIRVASRSPLFIICMGVVLNNQCIGGGTNLQRDWENRW